MKKDRIYQLIGAAAIATLLAGCDVKDPIYDTRMCPSVRQEPKPPLRLPRCR